MDCSILPRPSSSSASSSSSESFQSFDSMESDFSQGQYDFGACPEGPIEMPSFDYASHKYASEYPSQFSSMESLSFHFQSCATSSKVTAENLLPSLYLPQTRSLSRTDELQLYQSPVAPLYPHAELMAQVSPESAYSSELDYPTTPSELSPITASDRWDLSPSSSEDVINVVCNVPLVAPRPMPYTSPRFLKFELLPEHDEDLSYPPYTFSIKSRKRQRDDEGVPQFLDSPTVDFIPQKRQRTDTDPYVYDGDRSAHMYRKNLTHALIAPFVSEMTGVFRSIGNPLRSPEMTVRMNSTSCFP